MKVHFIFALVLITLRKWAVVPDLSFILVLFIVMLLFNFLIKKPSAMLITATIISLAVMVATLHVELYQYKTNIALSTNKNSLIHGKVISLFTGTLDKTRVILEINEINGQILKHHERFKAQLYWQQKKPAKQGQIWKIKARLREPYGRVNEAGFDGEVYYLSRHIHSKGSIIDAKLIDNNLSLRQQFYDWIYPKLQPLSTARFLVALSFGERNLLTAEDWSMLRNSGLAHLLAISGLHIGLAYFLGFYAMHFGKSVAIRFQYCLYLPYLCGLLFAFFYSWLAGFSLPTERAVVALVVFTLIRIQGFSISSLSLLLIVLCFVLAFDPFAVFSTSFWLSFIAVLILVVFFTLISLRRDVYLSLQQRLFFYIKQLFFIQCFFIFAMLPVMAVNFNGMSLSAVFFNLLAVPWISMCVVPLILLALFFSFFSLTFFWQLADFALIPLIYIIQYTENHWFSLHRFDFLWLCLIPILAMSMYWKMWRLPIFFTGLLVVVVFWRAEKIEPTAWQVDVLDVGHGLAVLIAKQGKAILYDTGTAWKKSSIAQAVINPILQKRNIELTEVILSHSDKDHAGGIEWLRQQFSNLKVRAVHAGDHILPCIAGESWKWQGIDFEVLFPNISVPIPKNEHSCIIRVSNEKNSLLLTGDLPAKQEALLLAQKKFLSSSVLVVPHHGSKSSSSLAFLQAVTPKAAIVSRGRYTPWNLPDPKIVERYRQQGIKWFDTAKHGQVRIVFSERGWQIETMRFDIHPYWYRNIFGDLLIKE